MFLKAIYFDCDSIAAFSGTKIVEVWGDLMYPCAKWSKNELKR
ncbi:hypothetical protein HanHA300_Chr06g0201871 [Helianthus annuus]|nr:hypothetical protein HanHA300_Chr06g0201871 [Helianthus annuus]KAJ0572552.1 hypothetical protein HanHA89_Chr06g0216961 [Helianthus annuus]KAJ0736994.1 hypothetical protein HanLR1_Chr06g0202001 [Helianthus annuus]